ncbi:MAG: histidine kinase N-terminal 7TM domain-containing protein, partial [Candidatus Omnitrophota bacterium]
MNLFAGSNLINGIAVFILGVFVYGVNRKSRTNQTYALFCFLITFWSCCYFFWQISATSEKALFFCRMLMAGAIFIPVSFLHFVLILLDLVRQKKIILRVGYLVFFLFLILNFTPYFVESVSPKLFFPFWPNPGMVFNLFLSIWFVYCLYSCKLLFNAYKYSSGIKRNQVKYVLLGILVGYISGSTNYFLWYNIPIPPYGNFIVPLFVSLMAYAIVKYRLMDINFVVTKTIAYGILLLISGLIYLSFIIIFDRFFLGRIWLRASFIHGCIFLLMAFMFIYYVPRMKVSTEKAVEKALFKNKYLYRDELRGFSRKISFTVSKEKLLDDVVSFISKVIQAPNVIMFLKDDVYNNYIPYTSAGFRGEEIKTLQIDGNSALMKWFVENKRVFIKEDADEIKNSQEAEQIKAALEKIKAYM